MDDMYKSIKVFLYDRTSSPLFGAFIISWSVINYRVLLTIFSGESLANKFEVINTLFQPIDMGFFFVSGSLLHGIIYPVIATLSYIYLYPRLAKPVYKHSLKKQVELREIKQEEEDTRLLTTDESRDIFREIAEVEEKFNVQQEKHRVQVSSLIAKIKELESVDKNMPDGFKMDEEKSEEGLSLRALNLHERINLLAKEEFVLSDLFNEHEWSAFSNSKKRNLGKKFKEAVEEGKYKGVKFNAFSSSNQALYVQLTKQNSLSDLQAKVLNTFIDDDPNRSNPHKDELFNLVGGHHIEFGLALEDLVDKKYLRLSSFPVGSYALEKKGRQYIIDNGFLKK